MGYARWSEQQNDRNRWQISERVILRPVAQVLSKFFASRRIWRVNSLHLPRLLLAAGTQTQIAASDSGGFRLAVVLAENRELRRANEILKAASAFFARELDPRPPK